MLGALIGDIVGSVYEWRNRKDKGFPLFQPDCRMTDDSVMTAAVASAVLMGGLEELELFQAHVITEMRRLGRKYPALGYGPGLRPGFCPRSPSPTAVWATAAPCGFPRWPGRRRAYPSAWRWPRPRRR